QRPTWDETRTAEREPRFVDVAEASGITDRYNGRGVALADYDLDGLVDIYVANQGGPTCYYINQTPRANTRDFLRIALVGRPDLPVHVGGRTFRSTRCAVGARVTLVAGGLTQMREVQGGMGFASQSEYPVHFGVPRSDDVERLTIRWPSSRVQEFNGDS